MCVRGEGSKFDDVGTASRAGVQRAEQVHKTPQNQQSSGRKTNTKKKPQKIKITKKLKVVRETEGGLVSAPYVSAMFPPHD